MARTRAQRRRQSVLLTIALVATLLALVFARDVSRAAHHASGPRRSENLSFAAGANALLTRENQFDQRLGYLLAHGATLSRPVFAARLAQLNDDLVTWPTAAKLLRRPNLTHGVNETLYDTTLRRVAAYESLLAQVSAALTLPFSTATPSQPDASPVSMLISSAGIWNRARFSLRREPGHARLDALSNVTSATASSSALTQLRLAPSLAVTRAVSLSALSVRPAALPSTPGEMLLPPVNSFQLGISVTNGAYVDQAVTLIVRLVPRSSRLGVYQEVLHATLGPLRSYAFVPKPLATVASEHATLTIRLVGAPGGGALTHVATYQVVLSPSGNG
ncbi:MAG: hypothetical protein KGJ10_07975 [Acidobacteriota bacterium]|nr:hypothetical protein [Acidobacteriota bacterium]